MSFGGATGLIGIRDPKALDTTYNPVGLWLFNGNLTDSGSSGENLTVDNGTIQYSSSHEHGKQAIRFRDNQLRVRGGTPASSPLIVVGDITVQAVFMMDTTVGIDTFGTNILAFGSAGGSGAEVNNDLYSLAVADVTGEMVPKWTWEYGAGNRETMQPVGYNLSLGQWYHMVGVRETEGGGLCTGRLYINGQLVLETPNLNEATGGGSSRLYLGRDPNNAGLGWLGGMCSSAKVVNRALTSREIKYEWLRVSGEYSGDRL